MPHAMYILGLWKSFSSKSQGPSLFCGCPEEISRLSRRGDKPEGEEPELDLYIIAPGRGHLGDLRFGEFGGWISDLGQSC